MESLSTRWNVVDEKVTDDRTDQNGNPKQRTTYYWVLNTSLRAPPEISTSNLPRYYPFSRVASPPLAGVFCIPENYVTVYELNDPPTRFPDVGLNIQNARDLDGNQISVIVQDLTEFQAMRRKGNAECNFDVALHGLNNPNITYQYNRLSKYFIFDHVKLPLDAQYVKLCDKDVALMCTGGGRNQPDEIFMTRELVEWFASNDGGNRLRFTIRVGDGTERLFEMDSHVSVTQAVWQKRLNRAINSIEGGWNRMINPVLKLYLVPLGEDLYDLAAMAQAAKDATNGVQKCLQTFQVFASSVLLAGNLGGPFSKLSTSPFNHYETWITTTDYNNYLLARPDREIAKQKVEDIVKIGALVGSKKEHSTAEAQRQRVNAAFGGTDYDHISIPVSAGKIAMARNTRPRALTQLEVMGVSATKVAEVLQWTRTDQRVQKQDIWPATGVFPAEWLHRCAYSWGGLGEAGNYHSSQLRQNIMFGTSECNSVMTRYEKNWQRFVTLEAEHRVSEKHEPLSNWKLHSKTRNTDPRRRVNGVQSSFSIDVNPTTCGAQWICYAMDYKLEIPGSKLMPLSPGYFEVTFYPFERGFFTVLEQRIDSLILDRLYKSKTTKPVPENDPADVPSMEENDTDINNGEI